MLYRWVRNYQCSDKKLTQDFDFFVKLLRCKSIGYIWETVQCTIINILTIYMHKTFLSNIVINNYDIFVKYKYEKGFVENLNKEIMFRKALESNNFYNIQYLTEFQIHGNVPFVDIYKYLVSEYNDVKVSAFPPLSHDATSRLKEFATM